MYAFEAAFAKVFNPANYAPPQANIGYASFGDLNAALPLGLGGNRTSQVALRMDF
jgi:hypothetical protein